MCCDIVCDINVQSRFRTVHGRSGRVDALYNVASIRGHVAREYRCDSFVETQGIDHQLESQVFGVFSDAKVELPDVFLTQIGIRDIRCVFGRQGRTAGRVPHADRYSGY